MSSSLMACLVRRYSCAGTQGDCLGKSFTAVQMFIHNAVDDDCDCIQAITEPFLEHMLALEVGQALRYVLRRVLRLMLRNQDFFACSRHLLGHVLMHVGERGFRHVGAYLHRHE